MPGLFYPHHQVTHLVSMLDFESLASISRTCTRLRKIGGSDQVWRTVCQTSWGQEHCKEVEKQANGIGWKRFTREMCARPKTKIIQKKNVKYTALH